MLQLQATIKRVHSDLTPDEFIEVVATAFQDASASQPPMDEQFRKEASFEHFQTALEKAHANCHLPASIVILGCGRGFAGVPASFATRALTQVFSSDEVEQIEELDLTPALLRECNGTSLAALGLQRVDNSYDLVVAHSLLHFIPNLAPVFSLVRRLLKRSGNLILSHEPNARFWRNSSCRKCLAKFQRVRRMRAFFSSLKRRLNRNRHEVPSPASSNRLAVVNGILRAKHRFADDLSEEEIRRLVDVHRPTSGHSTFKIGLDGFDFEVLGDTYLSQFHLLWLGTSGHLGYNEPHRLPAKWRRAEERLSKAFPLDGSVFTSFWKLA